MTCGKSVDEQMGMVQTYVSLGGSVEHVTHAGERFVITGIQGHNASGYRVFSGGRRYETIGLSLRDFEKLHRQVVELQRGTAVSR